ncbi:hypothetical protein L195_g064503, partial [Trifolium pratense]
QPRVPKPKPKVAAEPAPEVAAPVVAAPEVAAEEVAAEELDFEQFLDPNDDPEETDSGSFNSDFFHANTP